MFLLLWRPWNSEKTNCQFRHSQSFPYEPKDERGLIGEKVLEDFNGDLRKHREWKNALMDFYSGKIAAKLFIEKCASMGVTHSRLLEISYSLYNKRRSKFHELNEALKKESQNKEAVLRSSGKEGHREVSIQPNINLSYTKSTMRCLKTLGVSITEPMKLDAQAGWNLLSESVLALKFSVNRSFHEGLKDYVKAPLLETLPTYVLIQFMRWNTENQHDKLLTKIDFPLLLDVTDLCSENLKKTGVGKYELLTVLSHKGKSADSGHYLAWVKHEDKWHRYNDQDCTLKSEQDIKNLSGGGYSQMAWILTYKA